MDPKQLHQDVKDVLALAERLITSPDEDLESVTWDEDDKEEYANTVVQFQRVKALLLAAPDMLAVLTALLLSCELNTDDIEEHTLRLCYRAYKVLSQATGMPMDDDSRKLAAVAYDPAADATVCQVCYEDRSTNGAAACCYCGQSYTNPTTEREEVQA